MPILVPEGLSQGLSSFLMVVVSHLCLESGSLSSKEPYSMSTFNEYRDLEPSRDIERLLEIMNRLRDPESGCAWDIKQTFESIIPYTIEEAYEVKDAINRKDLNDLCEELGDLLLQVVYHAKMAEDQGGFSFGDVVLAVTRKMIWRHPHVFGTKEQREQGMQPGDWERIKAAENSLKYTNKKEDDISPSAVATVPSALPALIRAVKLQKKASNVGFDWNDVDAVFDKLNEEIDELKQEIDDGAPTENAIEELGDVLFVIANIARHLKIDPESALDKTNKKFVSRFVRMEQLARDAANNFEELNLDQQEELWQRAKKT